MRWKAQVAWKLPFLTSLTLRNSVLQYEWGIEIGFEIDLIHIYIIDDYIDKDGNICALLIIKIDNFRDARNAFLQNFHWLVVEHILRHANVSQLKKFQLIYGYHWSKYVCSISFVSMRRARHPQHNHICLKWFYSLHELRDRNKRKERI